MTERGRRFSTDVVREFIEANVPRPVLANLVDPIPQLAIDYAEAEGALRDIDAALRRLIAIELAAQEVWYSAPGTDRFGRRRRRDWPVRVSREAFERLGRALGRFPPGSML